MFEEKGSLSEVPAIRIVLSIFEQELTGILYLKNAETLKVLYMNEGKLVWAMSNSPKDKIEDILIAKGHSDAETIKAVRSEGTVSSSIGKLLVEKGHLNLEQLVEVTKIQAGRIVKSVMSWDHGGYQFVKEPPPERMFTLDINLMNFIFNFVLKELEMTVVWREIRTVRIHLERTKNQEKIGKYNLTERETSFLENFSEGTSIESVLSRYAGSHRDTLLRFVYFFIAGGLLEKLDIEDEAPEGAADEAPGESIGNLDGLFVDEQASETGLGDAGRDQDVEMMSPNDGPVQRTDGVSIERLIDEEPVDEGPVIEEAPVIEETSLVEETPVMEEAPVIETPTMHSGFVDDGAMDEGHEQTQEEIDDIGTISFDEPKSVEPQEEAPGLGLTAQTPERMDSGEVSIGDGIGAPEESGAYVMENRPPEEIEGPEDFDEEGLSTQPPVVPDKKKLKQFHYLIIFVIMILVIGGVIFLLLPEDELDLSDPAASNSQSNDQVVNVTERKPVTRPKKATTDTRTKQATTADVKKSPVAPVKKRNERVRKTPVKQTPPPSTDILRIFRQGDYRRAGELWRAEAARQGVRFSILLELDCQKSSVANAFKQCNNSKSFYIINVRRGSRTCYLVLWGRYGSESEASAAMGLIPGYFIRQEPPARVIDLQSYL